MSMMRQKRQLRNVAEVTINPATEDTLSTIASGLSGLTTDGSRALSLANTWYAIPSASVPTSDYILVVSKETSVGIIRWSFDNGGTPSASNGNKMMSDDIIIELDGTEVVYFGSSSAGDVVNFTTKEII